MLNLQEGKELFVAVHKQKMKNCSEEFQQNALLLVISHGYNFPSTRTFKRHIRFKSLYLNKEISI
jgi:hypothetical protein